MTGSAQIEPPASAIPRAASGGIPPHAQLIRIGISIWASRAVFAAAHLRLADLLADGPRNSTDLASATGTHEPSLYRLMRSLASLSVLTEVEPRRFALTTLGAALRSEAPGAARATLMTLAGDWQWKAWGDFLYSLQTGEAAIGKVFGAPLFEFLAQHPAEAADFSDAMVGRHGHQPPVIAAAYDFGRFKTLVDLGGASGHLLTTILRANPGLRGILFDLPHVISDARKRVDERGVGDRCELIVGDFFKEVPAGHDGYVLSHVLHDWKDHENIAILRQCRRAIAPDGRLLIVEIVLPPGDAPHEGKILDLLMLTVTGGIERTADEFAALLAAADFKLNRIVSTTTEQSIVEAVPA
jgi:SAM-dependent methyltransferase